MIISFKWQRKEIKKEKWTTTTTDMYVCCGRQFMHPFIITALMMRTCASNLFCWRCRSYVFVCAWLTRRITSKSYIMLTISHNTAGTDKHHTTRNARRRSNANRIRSLLKIKSFNISLKIILFFFLLSIHKIFSSSWIVAGNARLFLAFSILLLFSTHFFFIHTVLCSVFCLTKIHFSMSISVSGLFHSKLLLVFCETLSNIFTCFYPQKNKKISKTNTHKNFIRQYLEYKCVHIRIYTYDKRLEAATLN